MFSQRDHWLVIAPGVWALSLGGAQIQFVWKREAMFAFVELPMVQT